MLQIECPHCGVRDEHEYRFGGEAQRTRPEISVNDVQWADYLFNRDNPKGVQQERWCHIYGCGQWFNVERDTLSHEILRTYTIGALSHVGRR